MRGLEEDLRGAEEGCVRARAEVHTHSLLLEETARELERAAHSQEDAVLQLKEREDRLSHLLQDVAALKTTQESLSRTLTMKEHHNLQLTQDNTHLQQTLALLQDKIQASQHTVGVMRVEVDQVEVDQVRARLAEEAGLRQRLQSQLLQNIQDLERVQKQLANTRSAAAKKIHRRESKMASLLKELSECKKKHSDCQDELLSVQALMQDLQEDRRLTGSKMEEQNRELRQLRDTLETHLAVTSDEHHATHNLVSSRDQMILQLRTQLRTAEQMHQGSPEELAVLEAEVNRLNLKVKGQQEEACHLWEKVREGAELRNQEEKERLELQKQVCASQQQVKSQAGSIDQMTSDLEAVKQAHRTDTERWTQRNFLLHSQLEQVSCELSQSQAGVREQGLEVKRLRERLSQAEAGMQQAGEKVEVSEGSLKKRNAEIILLHKQLASVQEDLKETSSRAEEQVDLAAIFRQKYSAAMEKAQRRQGQRDGLEEELRSCQQQLGEAKREVGGIKAELAEMKGRYQEKLGQWESSEEALEQLTDELQSNQSALRESQERVGQCEGLIAALQQQLDSVTQQVGQCEGSLRSYQSKHSYSDEEFCSLQKHRQLLQRRCTEQADRLAECQQSLIQARAEGLHQTEELERQTQERAGLEHSLQSLHLDLAASHHTHMAKHTHLQQEVTCLQQEVTRLGLELDTARNSCLEKEQEVQERGALLQRCEEDLKETRACLERRSRELEEAREEVQREERDRRSTDQQNQRLRCHIRQHREETGELHTLHTHSVVELAASEDEVRRLEGCASEGRQAEEKRRATVERLEQRAQQLRQALQQTAEETVNTHRDKLLAQQQVKHYEGLVGEQTSELEAMAVRVGELGARLALTEHSNTDMRLKLTSSKSALRLKLTSSESALSQAQEKLDSLQSELEDARSDNTHLHQESQLVMSQVNHWVKEQRVTSESLAAQIRAQNKVLILITEEKELLEQANDSLKQDLRMLREELEEREREAGLWKVQDEEEASKQQQETERESCVLHNLSRLQEMQARLQVNLEAIAVLNQQLSVLGGENKALHRQLEEERSRRRRAEHHQQPSTHHQQPSTHHHQPLPNEPPSLLPHSLCPSPGEHHVELTRAELSMRGPQAPGEPQAVGEAFWRRRVGELSAQLQDGSLYWSEIMTAPTGSTSLLT
ncbi:myosin-9-like [Osmerus eperlanus]|uniref:myosin-9-like n=1 Tax=Osmerus eperlanus TaxID=29151 RepID=UPI002E107DBB